MRFGSLVVLALLPAGPLRAQDSTLKVREEKRGQLTQAKISSAEAMGTALARVPGGKVIAAEIEREKNRLVYSFDIKAGTMSALPSPRLLAE
jgi:uncharacterized membrane protein YkoI